MEYGSLDRCPAGRTRERAFAVLLTSEYYFCSRCPTIFQRLAHHLCHDSPFSHFAQERYRRIDSIYQLGEAG